jgi:hypothetical protein
MPRLLARLILMPKWLSRTPYHRSSLTLISLPIIPLLRIFLVISRFCWELFLAYFVVMDRVPPSGLSYNVLEIQLSSKLPQTAIMLLLGKSHWWKIAGRIQLAYRVFLF